jgi:hypothetical protein
MCSTRYRSTGYLIKPFPIRVLMEKVEHLIG